MGGIEDGLAFLRNCDPFEQLIVPLLAEEAAEIVGVRMQNAVARAFGSKG